jgi:hypothetical protein
MAWHAPHTGRQGRPPVFPNASIQFCLSIKVLFKLPLGQTAGMVASLLRQPGLDWPVPDCSTLFRRQNTPKVQIPYRRAGGPLKLLVDSSGIKFLSDGEWQGRCNGARCIWRWTQPPPTSARSSSPPAGKATALSYRSYSIRSPRAKTSAP